MDGERSGIPTVSSIGTQADMALYALACQGDEEAVEALLDRYRAPLTSFVRALLKDPRDIEETVIDAFAELCASRGRFRGKSSLKTYLFSIARHLALRHVGQAAELPLEDGLPQTLAQSLGLDLDLEGLPRRADLQNALSRLPERLRLALMLLYDQGMGLKEAGEVLGRSPSQVSRLAQKGRHMLKVQLEE